MIRTILADYQFSAVGMPYKTAYFFTLYLTRMLRYYAGLCDKISGETHSTDADGVFRIVNYEPYGVCAGVGNLDFVRKR